MGNPKISPLAMLLLYDVGLVPVSSPVECTNFMFLAYDRCHEHDFSHLQNYLNKLTTQVMNNDAFEPSTDDSLNPVVIFCRCSIVTVILYQLKHFLCS